jgi:hypothetical protein
MKSLESLDDLTAPLAAGFPSREPRRWRTGRNTQLNLKVSADVLARFTALAEKRRIPFGALLEQLIDEAGA